MAYGHFNEEAQAVWDFVRCVRSDGSAYGTGGQCRKGREVALLGEGKESKVYDIGKNRVLKVGSAISKEGDEAHRIASDLGVAPKLLRSGKKSGQSYQIMEKIKASDIEGLPHPGTKNSSGKPLEDLDETQMTRERDIYLAALKLNSKGVEHGDLHGGNMKWDESRDRPVIVDYDNGKLNPKSAAKEAGDLLNTIGARLESVDRYDEADDLYRLSKKISRKPTPELFEEAEGMVSSYFPTSPDDL